jgi:cell fate (sporulation/competence/biofilm development) regulator YlbF (YheA/YmcA/DUF963 family)
MRKMDIITQTRELGKAIQADGRYTFFVDIKKELDADTDLQTEIQAFQLERLNLDNEIAKDEKDTERLKELNDSIKDKYRSIMANPKMVKYEEAKSALDGLLSQINTIIESSVNGLDPETCPATQGCGGSCSTCGGCG